MRVLGIHLMKNEMRYAVLEGTKEEPTLVHKERLLTIRNCDTPELMNWFDDNFKQIIENFQPDKISYRLTLNPNKEQLFNLEFPFGILNYISYEKGIDIVCYTSQSFKASKLNKEKNTDVFILCDDTFGVHPPYWDKNIKYAILTAWFCM